MAVPEGTFRLYPSITPPLTAGDYRLTATQELSATRPGEDLGTDDLEVEPLATHVRVRAPAVPAAGRTRCSRRSRRPAARARTVSGCRRW